MTAPLPLIFYTVTNRNYFPGTVASISSIRTFHPHSPIHVVSECRAPLTPEQVSHLRSLANVHYRPETEIPVGRVREAWQMKAHVADYLSTQYHGVLVQVDSDAVLCAPLDDLAAEAARLGAPVGGKDGRGVTYTFREYAPYHTLCGVAPGEQDHFNPHYTSTSIFLIPIEPLREILLLWSIGVDKALFGPKERAEKLYAGYSDQGVLNAILYFKGITPRAIDGEILSEHWTHGRNPVTFRDGRFWNGDKQQRAFHSVGHAPKFWTKAYLEYVGRKTNLEPIYLYWLFQLFDGPCGFLGTHSPEALRLHHQALFPDSSPDLLEEYFQRRKPVSKLS